MWPSSRAEQSMTELHAHALMSRVTRQLGNRRSPNEGDGRERQWPKRSCRRRQKPCSLLLTTCSPYTFSVMWRPATRQITGTNEGRHIVPRRQPYFNLLSVVPLGNRRRFGPPPAEETAPPQLAQPSPSAYPRPSQHEERRPKEESPSQTGSPAPRES